MLKGLGNLANLGPMLKQAMEMKEKMEGLKEQLANEYVEGDAGAGMVRAVMNGKMELQRVQIDPSVVDPNQVEFLEDLVTTAVAQATSRAQELVKQRMRELTGGLDIPGVTS